MTRKPDSGLTQRCRQLTVVAFVSVALVQFGEAAQAHQRQKLERLCRYIARPAVANEPLALTHQGNIR